MSRALYRIYVVATLLTLVLFWIRPILDANTRWIYVAVSPFALFAVAPASLAYLIVLVRDIAKLFFTDEIPLEKQQGTLIRICTTISIFTLIAGTLFLGRKLHSLIKVTFT